MKYHSRKGYNPKQYLYVLLGMALLTYLEISVPFLRKDLIGAPYLLILTIAALVGDYLSGLIAIILGVFCIGFISQLGGHIDPVTIRRSIEFLVAGTTIYVLASKSRSLTIAHLGLEDTIKQLDEVITKLNSEVNNKKRDLNKFKRLNNELRNVIDDIMVDSNLWKDNVKESIKKTDKLGR